MLKRNRRSGFTLLELLIVVIIVSILAAVALPRFGKMTKRARASEAATAIGAILTAETLYYQEKSTFTSALADLLVDVDTTNFTYGLANSGGATATATATGAAGRPTAGIVVTGTISDTGFRTDLTTTGI